MPARPDHPRSRGVYKKSFVVRTACAGSSPLARGLRVPAGRVHLGLGIIPARAGFTGCPCWPAWTRTDHPRSRGVYSAVASRYQVSGGSSPLARGLRPHRRRPAPRRGIIPARAGFTTRRILCPIHTRDHPRSRGVYDVTVWGDDAERGSSPLARGLPPAEEDCGRAHGIIPARAGFTSGPPIRASRTRDHPRSRGVYAKLFLNSLYGKGSSPLARGLLGAERFDRGLHGIIPARAGFTRQQVGSRPPPADHPRSRGVYHPNDSVPDSRAGSSPLARGLHEVPDDRVGRGRIIPARAGFTLTPTGTTTAESDHPRSRGVYLPPMLHPLDVVGIIPARAGFTGSSRLRVL